MKTQLKKILILAIIAILSVNLPVFSSGRDYNFKHLSSGEGLSASNVKCILRDRHDFMWFGTKNGLNVYDGNDIYHISCFDKEKKHGNDNIGAIYEDGEGKIWVGTDRGLFTYDPVLRKFDYQDTPSAEGVRPDKYVIKITGDGKGNVWALLPTQGIFRFRDGKVEFYSNPIDSSYQRHFFSDFTLAGDNSFYAISNGSDIFQFNEAANRFDTIYDNRGLVGENTYFDKMIPYGSDRLLISTLDGHLFHYTPERGAEPHPVPFSQAGKVYMRDLSYYDYKIWIATHNGLFILDGETGREERITQNPLNPFSISDNSVFKIYRDHEGNAWLGTMFGGVDFHSSNPFRFVSYGPGTLLNGFCIRALESDSSGRIWVGTENSGLYVIDPKTNEIRQSIPSPAGSGNIMLSLDCLDDTIYAGYVNSGIQVLDTRSGKVSALPIDFARKEDRSGYAYLRDSRGTEWVGLGGRLLRRGAGEKNFRDVKATGGSWIFNLFEDRDGIIWIGTMGNGVWKYDPETGKYKNYTYDDRGAHEKKLRSNSISSIMQDSKGTVWFSTDRGGLSRYNPETDDFTSYGIREGLPDDVVYKVLEDGNGYLWFGTNKGLVKFNPRDGKCRVFTVSDGLPFNEFGYNAATVSPDGNFYFGGVNGVVSFNPLLDKAPLRKNAVYFTEVDFPDDSEYSGNKRLENLMISNHLELPYDCASFSVKVASPSYSSMGKRQFSYRLLPVNEEWIRLDGNRINFANLSPGKYVLEVRCDDDYNSVSNKMDIRITPPWWESVWAIILYILIAVGGVFLLLYMLQRRNENRNRQREAIYASEKEKELYRNKVSFFTEIAHEIRTPLSLIDIPLEAIEENGLDHPDSPRYIKMSRRNTRRLLSLINQLLDFQKLDSHKLTIKKENVSVSQLVSETAERFGPAMDVNHKTLEISLPAKNIIAYTDKEALTKILSNLLNNALKYAAKDISVRLVQNGESIILSVTSDGKKISRAERDLIFTPFYQGKDRAQKENGVGIGLPLAVSLANILGGELTLEDNDEPVNRFLLTIPGGIEETGEAGIDIEKENYILEEESNQTKERSDCYHILVAEDNDSIRSLLKERLSNEFIVETACDGEKAFGKMKDTHFDLLVTDVMMPVMDGMELCRKVKEDPELSSIPIVIITAKNDLDSKLEGLKLGAEAYIEKPFSIKYLVQTLKSLLDNRRRERESFSRKPFFAIDSMQTSKGDEEFINKCLETIREHLSEEDFNVETLCDILAMSRSNMLRKIKSIFNMSPSELIRVIRLKRAAELIQDGRYRIAEICEMVGISSPSYFSKLFFKQFNITPKAFEKQCRENSSGGENSL